MTCIVEQKVKNAFAEQLGASPDSITLENDFIRDLGADSLDLVEATMTLEDEFNCLINAEDFDALRTVGDLVRWLKQNTDVDK